MPRWQHILIKKDTHRKLKVISAEADVNICDIADEAINAWIKQREEVINNAGKIVEQSGAC